MLKQSTERKRADLGSGSERSAAALRLKVDVAKRGQSNTTKHKRCALCCCESSEADPVATALGLKRPFKESLLIVLDGQVGQDGQPVVGISMRCVVSVVRNFCECVPGWYIDLSKVLL